jgi:small-conductance mechanosensitive channel
MNELVATLTSLSSQQALVWGAATLTALVGYGALRLIVRVVRTRLERLAIKTSTMADDILVESLHATSRVALAALAVLASLLAFGLLPPNERLVRTATVILVVTQCALWANRAVSSWLRHQHERRAETEPGTVTTFQGLSYLLRLALWSAAALILLDNVGVDVTALVAGLGVGGIAIALAVQSILGDLFASLSIALDKPFVNGDFIIVDSYLGTIEKVGLKTTRVRSLSGEQIVFSNADLLSARIRNYKRMQERRVAFAFGVIYQTPVAALQRIPEMVRSIIEEVEHTRFDRAHFKAFGESAYDFEVVYYVLDPDYNLYMDVQQEINLELCRRFEAEGISFAYPTRTLYLPELHEGKGLTAAS